MHLSIRTRVLLSFIVVGLASLTAQAAVMLNYDDGDALPRNGTVLAGGTFSVNVQLVSNSASDAVNGLSYRASSLTNGVIQFVSRSIPSNSPFQFTNSGATPQQIVMSPDNGSDLGAANNDPSGSVSQATFPVSTLTFKVLASAASGSYTLSFDNTAFSKPSPDTTSYSFTQPFGTYSVLVVAPEPAALSLLSFAGLALCRKHRVA